MEEEVGDTIGESFSLVNTGENPVSKDSLDRGKALCYMQRELYLNMMGSVSDSSLLQVPVSTANRLPVRSISSRIGIKHNLCGGAT